MSSSCVKTIEAKFSSSFGKHLRIPKFRTEIPESPFLSPGVIILPTLTSCTYNGFPPKWVIYDPCSHHHFWGEPKKSRKKNPRVHAAAWTSWEVNVPSDGQREMSFFEKNLTPFWRKRNEAPPDNKLISLVWSVFWPWLIWLLPGIWKKCPYKMKVSIEIIPNL